VSLDGEENMEILCFEIRERETSNGFQMIWVQRGERRLNHRHGLSGRF